MRSFLKLKFLSYVCIKNNYGFLSNAVAFLASLYKKVHVLPTLSGVKSQMQLICFFCFLLSDNFLNSSSFCKWVVSDKLLQAVL